MSGLQDTHVLILGLGISGLAMARWCAAQGAQVTVADTRAAPPQLQALREQVPQARFITGPLDAALLHETSVRAVCRSPGLLPADIAALVQTARERGLPVWGELDLFTRALADLHAERGYAPQVIAITGTNGKTTVTALTGQLVARAGLSAVTAGNIGPSLLDTLGERLQGDALPQVWVLELSSFQLDGNTDFEPTVATVLNLTQDHLDWHGDMAAYAAAKARVFGARGAMALNRDDPLVMAMRPSPPPVKSGKGPKPAPRRVVTFGAGMPTEPGDFGIEMVNGMAWLVRAFEADETQRRRKDAEIELHLQRLMPADALRIRGRHNAVNALAALALAVCAGAALGPMLYGLREYRGEPHRVESIGVLNGVEYFDDSKGTNVGATVAALQGLGAERKLVVILGGEGKGQDFAPLREPLARHARAALLIGRDAGLIRAALEGANVPLIDAGSLEQAVALARERAQAGDAVLLSPACASLDMFRDYVHRAEVFADAVRALAREEGIALELTA
jgi:UDP-N-acetylmuramoylalanine--D-glutamate ligase